MPPKKSKGVRPVRGGQVRIVGGDLRRSVLGVADSRGLRPTPDRVRETLFNWVGPRIRDARCLDLFAGTGALGIEAVSRGAARVVLNDSQPAALRAAVDLLDRASRSSDAQAASCARRTEVCHHDAIQLTGMLAAAGEVFDLVFLDPPFEQGWLRRVLPRVQTLLASGGLVYVESEQPADEGVLAEAGWTLHRSGRAGQVYFYLLKPAQTESRP